MKFHALMGVAILAAGWACVAGGLVWASEDKSKPKRPITGKLEAHDTSLAALGARIAVLEAAVEAMAGLYAAPQAGNEDRRAIVRYEYKTVEFPFGGVGNWETEQAAIEGVLNNHGRQGWRLRQIEGIAAVLVFERRILSEPRVGSQS